MMSREVKQGVETGNVSTESVTILVGTEYSDGYSTHNTLSSTGGVDILVDNSGNKNINENISIVIDKGKKAKDNGKGDGAQGSGGNQNAYQIADGFGQMMNAGGVIWGAAEKGGNYLRQNNGAQVI